ncbi:MAG: DNA translocase FtsK 4TM domain-containing protein [Bacteroidales bacterium]|jgi:S-DNA-T family DNA segregation ATPase FtsK/SpoIIIE|nr:DNA translocase FtsK 4TM domain-containing protein [Bacteroidales bacterium]
MSGKSGTGQKTNGRKNPKGNTEKDERVKFIFGALFTALAIYLLFALIAYILWWKTDQSLGSRVLTGPEIQVRNWSGKSGHWLADLLITRGFGVASFLIPVVIGSLGLYMLNLRRIPIWSLIIKIAVAIIIISLTTGYLFGMGGGFLGSGPGGAHGYLATRWLNAFMGKIGTGATLSVLVIAYLVFALKVSPEALIRRIPNLRLRRRKRMEDAVHEGEFPDQSHEEREEVPFTITGPEPEDENLAGETGNGSLKRPIIRDLEDEEEIQEPDNKDVSITITHADAGETLSDDEVHRLMEDFDPRLDLPRYQFPPVTILREYQKAGTFDDSEVIENKSNIINALADHKINIRSISATVGPTVTLYEVVPERGVRIARIKSLENDIALNLSALGIRIIAPIPGRGTVGIEVPNKKPETVSMRSLITSRAFQESKAEIALALGRTITNDPFIVDLTRMPHLLVAGATGQGKSVGINAVITSILYKKHPAEVKFVLIDPKRVELPLYAKIERHYLAKLPGDEDAIITDTRKVINTLNSLCIEMDNRLELMKAAGARNVKEYNEKFINRRLNPQKGHRYMPYIVLIIDEFADLIMTAGREIEGPIGRLAQLARAIGIHLIISTQRPSTNIITGFIKANFPVRIAFRVFSSVDSRTILDANGADQLVGRGDMLVSTGAEPVRVQCAFIDTPEIEELTDFIGSQQGYPEAMLLPEYFEEGENGPSEVDLKKRDSMFDEAARMVVQYQQGSTSLIQRKLSIGYNRAGRIIDQLEAAGIVGPFEGSKARDVLITDMSGLERILNSLE